MTAQITENELRELALAFARSCCARQEQEQARAGVLVPERIGQIVEEEIRVVLLQLATREVRSLGPRQLAIVVGNVTAAFLGVVNGFIAGMVRDQILAQRQALELLKRAGTVLRDQAQAQRN